MAASLAAATAVFAGDTALHDRKAIAETSILGVPTLIQAPEKVEKGPLADQLAAAQAEAKKWKDTLDDDRKLQEYLTQKARDDFNKAEVAKLDLSRSPSTGPKEGPITVVSFSDFMCPFCRNLALGLKSYLPSSGNQVKVHYKNFPLDTTCNPRIGQSLHPGSCQLALGGICAEESGRFWEYHDKVFAQTWDRAAREDVLRIGVAAGLDGGKLASCIESAATKGRLSKDVDEGWRVGVESTPTIFVNGRKLPSTGVFLLAIEEERKRLNLPALSTPPLRKDK
jgi:protein-disulfide isomerase